ncbi:MFS transporter [Seonamhaeicola marinus]|uniref:MFS transporter n=1 Tax=Seonamhaeicola marinus TaxID=1912246 RepID=A0A5D0HJP3_9FLAO|nr:MFS transporter [Seonamhaeicola marinus]TYA71516.1 MFS transporter [Seonamhaeicola marinus]
MVVKKRILPIIVIAQFLCTSLWFAGNAIIKDLVITFNLTDGALGHLTTAVQLGFILGTLLFAIFTITDRFSPSKVFFVSAVIAAVCNVLMNYENQNMFSLTMLRFFTGFFLAGIYPVGMKIASDYYKGGLGKSLGFLVGALVLGTALPHLLKAVSFNFSWQYIVYVTSTFSVLGGVLMLAFVPDGPYKTKLSSFDVSVFYKVFKTGEFRSAAFGYFGHMWELYSFWAFVPFFLMAYNKTHEAASFNVALLSFGIIGIGGVACVLSGYLSNIFSTKQIATLSLGLSCLCCFLSPFFFIYASPVMFMIYLLFWGIVVIADSPMFSTLVAQNVNQSYKGTALTIVNCIGFAITVLSIQLINLLKVEIAIQYLFLVLAIGPVLGLVFLFKGKVKA